MSRAMILVLLAVLMLPTAATGGEDLTQSDQSGAIIESSVCPAPVTLDDGNVIAAACCKICRKGSRIGALDGGTPQDSYGWVERGISMKSPSAS